MTPSDKSRGKRTFDRLQAQDMANEVRILWSEVAVCAVLVLLVALYLIVG